MRKNLQLVVDGVSGDCFRACVTAKFTDLRGHLEVALESRARLLALLEQVSDVKERLKIVEEVKRLGKVVYLAFFAEYGLSPELHMASDHFFEMGAEIVQRFTSVAAAPGSAATSS